jgi:lactate racemase
MQEYLLPQLRWYEKRDLRVAFPENWDVTYCPMQGAETPGLTDAEIADSLQNPIATKPIRQSAKGCKEVVIVFDDFSRATPVSQIVPHVIAELHRAGIRDDQIRFICALGAHGAHDMQMFRKKLGADIVKKYPIYNHNCYEHCTHIGDTPQGTPLWINDEYLNCDYRIAVGSVAPHVHEGFSGGGKIILPGIAHIDSIKHLHTVLEEKNTPNLGLGKYQGNLMSQDSLDAARIAKLDIKIDAILNLRGDICKLYAGEPSRVFAEACLYATDHYATPATHGNDVVVVNCYAKANEMAIANMMGILSMNHAKAIIVIVYNAPEGQMTHYVFRSFGKRYGGERFKYSESYFLPSVQLVALTEYPDCTSTDWFVDHNQVTFTSTWDETLEIIKKSYPDGGKAAIIPDATAQYFRA